MKLIIYCLMNKQIESIEKPSACSILISLLDGKKYLTQLTKDINNQNFHQINKTLNFLDKIGLILDKTEKKTSEGKYVGIKRYIELTQKGKIIAEKLVEIEKILEKKVHKKMIEEK